MHALDCAGRLDPRPNAKVKVKKRGSRYICMYHMIGLKLDIESLFPPLQKRTGSDRRTLWYAVQGKERRKIIKIDSDFDNLLQLEAVRSIVIFPWSLSANFQVYCQYQAESSNFACMCVLIVFGYLFEAFSN